MGSGVIGRYRVIEKLGEGGMAAVFKVYDPQLDREVAVKMIHTSLGGEKMLKRFEREARALGQLAHPNIVKVLDYGEQDGRPYLVMEYIPGGKTLRDQMGSPLPYKEAARLLLPVVEAVAFAHQRHIIHRDIKPTNILIREDGAPKLADFGIAKFTETEPTIELTGAGAVVGTPEYMAPEQILGQDVDERADLYALGCVFYEMVTGRKPFDATTPIEMMFQKVEKSVPPPRLVVPDLPQEVERLILSATEKNTWDRLGRAEIFAEALRQFIQGDATLTAEVRREIARPTKRKLPLWAALAAAGTVVAGLLLAYLLAGGSGRLQGMTNEAALSPQAIAASTAEATSTWTVSPPPILPQAVTSSPTAAVSPTLTLTPEPSLTPTITPFPTREFILEENIKQIELLYAVNVPETDYFSSDFQFSPDGSFLVLTNGRGQIQVWRTMDWKQVYAVNPATQDPSAFSQVVVKVLFSPDGSQVVIARSSGIEIRSTQDWKLENSLKVGPSGSGYKPIEIAVSPDGQMIASISVPQDWSEYRSSSVDPLVCSLQIWSLQDGGLSHEMNLQNLCSGLNFSPDGQLLAIYAPYQKSSSNWIQAIWLWRTGDGSLSAILEEEYGGVFSQDSRYMAGIYLWDLAGCAANLDVCGKQVGRLRNPGWRFDSQRTFLKDNTLFTTLGRIWQTKDAKVYYTIEGLSRSFNDTVITPDKRLMIIQIAEGLVFYDLEKLMVLFQLPGISFPKSGYIKDGKGVYLSPDGTLLATRQSELLRVRRTSDGGVVYSFDGVPSVLSLAFSPDGRLLEVVNQPTTSNIVMSYWGLPWKP